MEEAVAYIFRSLYCSEISISKLNKTVQNQKKKNRLTTYFMLVCCVKFIADEIRDDERDSKIKALTSEVEELKNMKGK